MLVNFVKLGYLNRDLLYIHVLIINNVMNGKTLFYKLVTGVLICGNKNLNFFLNLHWNYYMYI